MKKKNLIIGKFGETWVGPENRIIPERYVWHVSNSFEEWKFTFKNRGMDFEYFKTHYVPMLRRKIALEGLCFKNYNAVFAHNGQLPPYQMHPIWLDICFSRSLTYYHELGDYRFLTDYTFWRIDTRNLDIPWYVDPFMGHGDRRLIDGYPDQNKYILTPNQIPPTAITCFEYRLTPKRAALVERPNLPEERREKPWDHIRPVYEINNLIYHAAAEAA